ncbi:podocan-like [Augochlora pura]
MAPTHFLLLIWLLVVPSVLGIRKIVFHSNNKLNIEQHVSSREPSVRCPPNDGVNITALKLDEIPQKCFVNSSFIKNINMEKNLFTKIPTDLFDCTPNLECLNVAFNKIAPDEMFNFKHPNLKTLMMDHQILDRSYHWVYGRRVSTWGRYDDNFPSMEKLQLNGFGDYVLSYNYGELFPRLSNLYLKENNITIIDNDFVSRLPLSLEHLHLEGNHLHDVNLHEAGYLLSLYLDNNPFSGRLPLNVSNVLVLSLRNCGLKSPTLNHFLRNDQLSLELLDLSDNHLEYVPANLLYHRHTLQTLILKGNMIEELSDVGGLTNLKKLSLSSNGIRRVQNLGSSSLEILALRDNRIEEISAATFAMLPLLKELDLSYNRLESLPLNWMSGLSKLERLDLNSNRFARFADISLRSTANNLWELYVKDNRFDDIDEVELETLPEHCRVYVA